MESKLKEFANSLQPFDVHPPRMNEPINLSPLPPLPMLQPIAPDLLQKMGIVEQKDVQDGQAFSFFSLLPSCGSCSCKAMSRETLNEISRHPELEKQSTEHLTDAKKKKRFKEVFSLLVKASKEEKQQKFEEMYKNFGHGNEEEWRMLISKLQFKK